MTDVPHESERSHEGGSSHESERSHEERSSRESEALLRRAAADMPAVGVEILPHAADLPSLERMTPGSSGYDLRAAGDGPLPLEPGRLVLVPTGLRLEIPPEFEAQVRPRSGLAVKHQIGVLNSPGTIDSDFRGEVKVLLYNFGSETFTVERGERIAQLVFVRVQHPRIEIRELGSTQRSSGGFGHTGRS